jgi:hypothetical protein
MAKWPPIGCRKMARARTVELLILNDLRAIFLQSPCFGRRSSVVRCIRFNRGLPRSFAQFTLSEANGLRMTGSLGFSADSKACRHDCHGGLKSRCENFVGSSVTAALCRHPRLKLPEVRRGKPAATSLNTGFYTDSKARRDDGIYLRQSVVLGAFHH